VVVTTKIAARVARKYFVMDPRKICGRHKDSKKASRALRTYKSSSFCSFGYGHKVV